ncbi:MAG TPA: hypothetical protein ENH48_04695 [Halieaceae bacterium]|nr:MAG: hypothetical protein DRQ98_06790 [Gammaproteobacteria bacterium]HDY82238.1 hypothetical protein [Halieaceae bacterium]
MASFPRPIHPGDAVQGTHAEAHERVTVHVLFMRHRQFLSGLPGEVSQFDQSDFGYEWRCEFEIGACSPAATQARADIGHSLHLHFSLIDLDQQSKPAAVLYLVEHGHEQDTQDRLLLPLKDLTETHEQLNERLTQRHATIAVFDNAHRFIVALTKVRESLGNELAWA